MVLDQQSKQLKQLLTPVLQHVAAEQRETSRAVQPTTSSQISNSWSLRKIQCVGVHLLIYNALESFTVNLTKKSTLHMDSSSLPGLQW